MLQAVKKVWSYRFHVFAVVVSAIALFALSSNYLNVDVENGISKEKLTIRLNFIVL